MPAAVTFGPAPGPRYRAAETKTAPSELKRRCEHDTQSTQPSCTAASPQFLSLDAAMRAQPRRRLYVHPLAGGERHLELLGAAFDAVKPWDRRHDDGAHDDAAATTATTKIWDSPDSLCLVGRLSGRLVDFQRLAMTELLLLFGLTTEYASWILNSDRRKGKVTAS